MWKTLKDDIAACMARDPAATSRVEFVLTYPGFHAVMIFRLAHWLWGKRWRLTARLVSYFARMITGIEIHPAARIGRGFFIDHGLGVVIGETSEIGDDVTLYHDVTLGGIAPSIDSERQRSVKRHPTLRDGVIVGSGAQILGPITIGHCARVGANSVVLADVPEGVTVVGIPARRAGGPRASVEDAERFEAYGTRADMRDPVQHMTEALMDRVQTLSMRIEELERRLGDDRLTAWSPRLAELGEEETPRED